MFHNYYLPPNISVKNNTNTDSRNIIKPKVKHVKEKRQMIQWILIASVQKGGQLGRGDNDIPVSKGPCMSSSGSKAV